MARALTSLRESLMTAYGTCSFVLQSPTVVSLLPVANSLPSRESAMQVTILACARQVPTRQQSGTLQILIFPSHPPDRSADPSGSHTRQRRVVESLSAPAARLPLSRSQMRRVASVPAQARWVPPGLTATARIP